MLTFYFVDDTGSKKFLIFLKKGVDKLHSTVYTVKVADTQRSLVGV